MHFSQIYSSELSKTTRKINYLHFEVHLVTVTTPGIYISTFLPKGSNLRAADCSLMRGELMFPGLLSTSEPLTSSRVMCGTLVPWSLIGPQLDKQHVSREKCHSCRHIIILNSIWTGTKGDKIKKFSIKRLFLHQNTLQWHTRQFALEHLRHSTMRSSPFFHTYIHVRKIPHGLKHACVYIWNLYPFQVSGKQAHRFHVFSISLFSNCILCPSLMSPFKSLCFQFKVGWAFHSELS